MTPVTLRAVETAASLLLTCEHASAAVPAEYDHLGLSPEHLRDHIAWDIGAAAVVEEISRRLGAPAVLSAASRLLVDCNRGLSDHDLIPTASCGVPIPGNANVSRTERQRRLETFYRPYHEEIDRQLESRAGSFLLSVHSFTPSLNGLLRPFDVGVLFDEFSRPAAALADGLRAAGFEVRMNQPYSAFDGLIFSARAHGRRHGVRYLEIEINNSLLSSESEARAVARRLCPAVAGLVRD